MENKRQNNQIENLQKINQNLCKYRLFREEVMCILSINNTSCEKILSQSMNLIDQSITSTIL